MSGDRQSLVDHDIVIVGGGLAGLTAGLFAARCGRSTLVMEAAAPGGHLVNVTRIEDYPGLPAAVAGYELAPSLQEQAAQHGAHFGLAEVQRLERLDGAWHVTTTDGTFRAPVVIVASGSRPRCLGIPGESRLLGRGVSRCASCDGPLYRGMKVGVVGGGDSALQEALTLVEYASEIVLFHRGSSFRAQATYRQRLEKSTNIRTRFETIVEEVLGETNVNAIRVRSLATGAVEDIGIAGLFVYVGSTGNTEFLGQLLSLDDSARIPTDPWMRTEQPGLFAAGDVRCDSASQAVTVAGDGATAAIAAHRYLANGSWPS